MLSSPHLTQSAPSMQSPTIYATRNRSRIVRIPVQPFRVLVAANTIFLIAANASVVQAGAQSARWIDMGALHPLLVWKGEIWRLFTAMFVHANFLHFAFNTFVPTANFNKGLGTGHVSLEPAVLLAVKVTPSTYVQSELAYRFPISLRSQPQLHNSWLRLMW